MGLLLFKAKWENVTQTRYKSYSISMLPVAIFTIIIIKLIINKKYVFSQTAFGNNRSMRLNISIKNKTFRTPDSYDIFSSVASSLSFFLKIVNWSLDIRFPVVFCTCSSCVFFLSFVSGEVTNGFGSSRGREWVQSFR